MRRLIVTICVLDQQENIFLQLEKIE